MNLLRLVGTFTSAALVGATTLVVGAQPALAATTWWVDRAAPNCSNTGPGTAETPLCTISAGAARAVGAGDVVTVRPGAYQEQVNVAGSGTSAAPITFTASGPGVTVVGTRDLSAATWTPGAPATWSTPYAPPSAPRQVFVDGTRFVAGPSATGLTGDQFFHDSAAKVLHVRFGDGGPSGRVVLAGAQTYGFNVVGRSSVAISGFALSGQNNAGVRVSGSSGITVDRVSSVDAGVNGVLVESSSNTVSVTASTVRRSASVGIKLTATSASRVAGNTVTRAGNHGISVAGSPGATVEGNESADNVVTSGTASAAGIDINSGSTDAVVRGNLVHDNQDSGVQVYSGSHRALVVRNLSYANGDHGLDTLASVGVRYISNTAYRNRTDGISLEGQSTGATLRNNISVDNGLATGLPNLYVEQASLSGFSADRDVFWNSEWVPSVRVGLTRYQTLAAYAAATGQEGAGLGVDPHFADPAAADFRLSANSAAIDSADASAAGFAAVDRAGTQVVDDPNVPDTGVGGPTFADRGALERVPSPSDPSQSPPYAALVLSASAGQVPPGFTVTADASGSSDADANGIASYTFDFGDGTVVGPQPTGSATHTYVTTGSFTVIVRVTDTAGATDAAQRPLTLTARPLVTYRVDRGDPTCSDGANGVTTPFCTISRGASVALAGDTVVVESGDYPEQVTPAHTGMPGAPLTFRANGDDVRLIGTTDLSAPETWAPTGTAAWRTPVTSASAITQVFVNGSRLDRAASATTTTAGSFFHDPAAATLYVDVGGPSPSAAGTVLASTRTYGFKLWKADTVVVDGFTSWGVNGIGFSVQDAKDVLLDGVTASHASSHGISADRSTRVRVLASTAVDNGSIGIRMAAASEPEVRSSVVHDNGYHGISLQGSSNGHVAGNTAYANAHPLQRVAAGIDVSLGSTGMTVERNRTYANQDSGIQIYTGSDNAVVRRNISHDNGDHGLDCLSSPGERVVGNTVVGNDASGINLEGGCSGSTVGNNISVDNAVASTRTIGDIRLDEASAPGSTVDYNLVHQSNGGPLYEWDSKPHLTVESFRAASGQGAHDDDSPPRFVDLAGRDLALTIASPAVDSAHLGLAGAAAEDHDGIDPVDVLVVLNSGAGNPPYGDRGALEYHGGEAGMAGPTAALVVTPTTGTAPLTVAASAQGSRPGTSPIVSYTFGCGNGTTVGPQMGATTSCTYPVAGTFEVRVTVADLLGMTDTATATVTVVPPNAAPVASLAVASAPGPVAPTTAGFDASGSSDPEGGPLTFTFTCGNGTKVGPQPEPTATCTYATGGSYNATVTVMDDHGNTSTSGPITLVIASNQAPTARLVVSFPSGTTAPTTAALDGSGSSDPEGGPLSYTFRCGHGTVIGPTSSATTTCTYTRSGRYTVRLTVTDTAGQSSSTSESIRLQ